MITYKYRLYPNKEQKSNLWKHANKLNWLYNYFLNQKVEAYKKDKTSINRFQQQTELITLKANDETIRKIHSQVLQQVTLRLDKTYQQFFNRGFGFPNFRSCRNFFGICYPQKGYSIENNKFITKVYGIIKFKKHKEFQGNIKQVTVTSKNDKWFLCIYTDYEKVKVINNEVIGIDVGITNIVATSDGEIIKNCEHAKYFNKIINKIKSRRDKNCKKKGRRYKFLSKVIRRLYDVKNRKVSDFLHKVSKNLSRTYDTIIVEDLNLKEMSESKITGLNRELRNSQVAKLMSYLSYKANRVIKVNPKNTSKICNNCGKIHKMPLWNRELKCECGYKEDRDINAAKNIYCLGRAFLITGRTVAIQEAITFR